MDTVVLSSLLNGALLLVCLGLLLSFCVSCGQSWRQTATRRYNHEPRPGVSNPPISLTPAPPSLRFLWPEPERRPSYTPTTEDDEESTRSSQNQISRSEQDDYVNGDKNSNNDDYIKVLPPKSSSMEKNESQPNLASGNKDYENVKQKPAMRPVPHDNNLPNPKPPETLDEPSKKTAVQETGIGDDSDCDPCSSDYINMLKNEKGGLAPGKSQESMESDGNGSTDYVNISPK